MDGSICECSLSEHNSKLKLTYRSTGLRMLRKQYIKRRCAEAKLHGWAPNSKRNMKWMMEGFHQMTTKPELTANERAHLAGELGSLLRPLGTRKLTLTRHRSSR